MLRAVLMSLADLGENILAAFRRWYAAQPFARSALPQQSKGRDESRPGRLKPAPRSRHIAACRSMARTAMIAAVLAGCGRKLSTTDLRLVTHSEGGREWIEVIAPPQALKINGWVQTCRADVEVLYQSPRVLSLACREGTGRYGSFRLDDGERLSLATLLQPGAEGPLQEAVNRYLRKKHFGEFQPTDNFALTAQGLMFPTTEGDVVVSSIELRPLLHPSAALLVGR